MLQRHSQLRHHSLNSPNLMIARVIVTALAGASVVSSFTYSSRISTRVVPSTAKFTAADEVSFSISVKKRAYQTK